MNAQDWLAEATKGMPEAVCARVAAETLAHLEDAGVGEGADVIPVLGSPRTMRQELGRLYVSADRLRILVESPSSNFMYVAMCLFLALAYFPMEFYNKTIVGIAIKQVTLVVLILHVVSPVCIKSMHSLRRRLWRNSLNLAALYVGMWLSFASQFLNDGREEQWLVPVLIVWPFLLCQTIWDAWHEDQRLRRTLALVGGAQL